MIKKFEQFVNENLKRSNKRQSWTYDEIESFGDYLVNTCGLEPRITEIFSDRVNHSAYTSEELIDVFEKMNFEDMPKSCQETFLNALLQSILTAEDSTIKTIKSLKETLDLLSKECNNGKPFPVVVDVNGKLLTGEVYYNEYFDFYTETEEEMREKIMEEIFSDPLEYGIRHKDDFMDIDGQHDATIYELIDLNKKFGWKFGNKSHRWRDAVSTKQ
jgi:hypothetical protein